MATVGVKVRAVIWSTLYVLNKSEQRRICQDSVNDSYDPPLLMRSGDCGAVHKYLDLVTYLLIYLLVVDTLGHVTRLALTDAERCDWSVE